MKRKVESAIEKVTCIVIGRQKEHLESRDPRRKIRGTVCLKERSVQQKEKEDFQFCSTDSALC